MDGESRKHELRRNPSKSTTSIQKEDYAAHATVELAVVDRGDAVANRGGSGSNKKEFDGEHRWTARERTVIASMEQNLNKSEKHKS